MLTMLALVDFLSGIALRTRRGNADSARRCGRKARGERQPPSYGRAANSISLSLSLPRRRPCRQRHRSRNPYLLDHPEPTHAHPEVASHAPSPQVASPELQPGAGSPPRDASSH